MTQRKAQQLWCTTDHCKYFLSVLIVIAARSEHEPDELVELAEEMDRRMYDQNIAATTVGHLLTLYQTYGQPGRTLSPKGVFGGSRSHGDFTVTLQLSGSVECQLDEQTFADLITAFLLPEAERIVTAVIGEMKLRRTMLENRIDPSLIGLTLTADKLLGASVDSN